MKAESAKDSQSLENHEQMFTTFFFPKSYEKIQKNSTSNTACWMPCLFHFTYQGKETNHQPD